MRFARCMVLWHPVTAYANRWAATLLRGKMEIPREELNEVIDRFEKDIEAGISSRNWLPYLAKIRAWLASGPTPVVADVAFCDCVGSQVRSVLVCKRCGMQIKQRG